MRKFLFGLALALGFAHPDYLLEMLDSRQISEWMAYYGIEPWGYRTDWLRFGVLSSVTANVHRIKKSRAFKPEDFVPGEPSITVPMIQPVEEQKEMLHRIYAWAKKRKLTKEK